MAGSIIGGIMGNKAADAQADAAKDATQTQRYMFDKSVELSEPWRAGGENALQALQYELGLGALPTNLGGTTRFRVGDQEFSSREEAEKYRNSLLGGGDGLSAGTYSMGVPNGVNSDNRSDLVTLRPTSGIGGDDEAGLNAATMSGGAGGGVPDIEEISSGGFEYAGFQETPGYQFNLDEGQKAINRSLAARGGLLSGNAVKEGMRFSQGLADQTYSNHLARLANVAGLGSGVAAQQGANAIQTGQGIASSQIQGGNARASGYAATGQAIGGGFNALAGLAGRFFGF